MTWGMHAIGHLELGQEEEAGMMFDRSYLPYVQVQNQPFELFQLFVLSSLRFTCGARCQAEEGQSTSSQGWEASFRQAATQSKEKHNIQAVLYGYLGVRAHIDHMEVSTFLPSHALTLFITINFTAGA